MMSEDLHTHVQQIAEELKIRLETIRKQSGFDAGWKHPEQPYLTPAEEEQVAEAMNLALVDLAATGITGPANQLPSQILWNVAGEQLKHGSLQMRARTKPRGYAGDDVLLRQIFEYHLCSHPLGRAFDRFFQSLDAPAAVRGRIQIAAQVIHESLNSVIFDLDPNGPLPVMPVTLIGAGPAIEVELAIQSLEKHDVQGLLWMKAVLFDLDEAALINAEHRLKQIYPEINIQTVRENLFRLARQPRRAQAMRKSNAIICLGIMDYLDDEDAAGLLALCYRKLVKNGIMLVGNFSPQCRARTYMEWIGNWYLNYRTSDELHALAVRADIPEACFRIETDPTGVNLLLRADRR